VWRYIYLTEFCFLFARNKQHLSVYANPFGLRPQLKDRLGKLLWMKQAPDLIRYSDWLALLRYWWMTCKFFRKELLSVLSIDNMYVHCRPSRVRQSSSWDEATQAPLWLVWYGNLCCVLSHFQALHCYPLTLSNFFWAEFCWFSRKWASLSDAISWYEAKGGQPY